MPTRDFLHGAVKNALVKDGWTITADPYVVEYEDMKLFADLGAEHPLLAEREGRKIIVEVKSFLGPSPVHDLEQAVGQYQIYRVLLEQVAPMARLFLAVSDLAHSTFFERDSVQLIVQRLEVSLLIVNPDVEEIVKWID